MVLGAKFYTKTCVPYVLNLANITCFNTASAPLGLLPQIKTALGLKRNSLKKSLAKLRCTFYYFQETKKGK
jgi:hypothetical protein